MVASDPPEDDTRPNGKTNLSNINSLSDINDNVLGPQQIVESIRWATCPTVCSMYEPLFEEAISMLIEDSQSEEDSIGETGGLPEPQTPIELAMLTVYAPHRAVLYIDSTGNGVAVILSDKCDSEEGPVLAGCGIIYVGLLNETRKIITAPVDVYALERYWPTTGGTGGGRVLLL